MLRRWAHLTRPEQTELELALAVARRSPGFNWSQFCYAHNIRQWSLRGALDDKFRNRPSVVARPKTTPYVSLPVAVAPIRLVQPERRPLTASLLGDPLPEQSALYRDGPARLWTDRCIAQVGGNIGP